MSQPNPSGTDTRRTVARGYDMQYHGTAEFRGADCPRSKYYDQGRFGRLFPLLPSYSPEPISLMKLGAAGGPMDPLDPPPPAVSPNNPNHPDGLAAGFTFLGQFLDHDITFDPTSSLERQVDPEAVANFRTPVLELDNVYGSGPGPNPFLYQRRNRDKLLVGSDTSGAPNDLPRNAEGTALIGDPRNDENLIVSQLHLAFIKFHNAVVDHVGADVPPGRSRFEEAQRLVRWHYQWIILKHFLPAIVGQKTVDTVLSEGRKFYKWRNLPYIPVEFAVAAYRFGHSMVRPGYAISANFARPLFPAPPGPGEPPPQGPLPGSLAGGRQIAPEQVIEWHRFFAIDPANPPQVAKRFDPKISTPLHHLPFAAGTPEDPASLAQRNLLRGRTFNLPSGQAVARAMQAACGSSQCDYEPLTKEELAEVAPLNLEKNTPLWYYVLKEAEVRASGRTLGPVGGRIVAEVFIGLLQGDPLSYLSSDPYWEPLFGADDDFTMVDLLKFAGVAAASVAPAAEPTWA